MPEITPFDPPQPLSDEETTQLEACEAAIEHGAKTFVRVGNALAVIRDSKLYRQTHETFDAYCKDRWGITDRYARDTIASAKVISETGSNASGLNQRQASELAKVEPERREEVLEKAAASGKVSARSIREAAAPEPSPPDPAAEESEPEVEDQVVRDRVGRIVPDIFPDTQRAFTEADILNERRSAVRKLKKALADDRDHPAFAFISWADVDQLLDALRRAFRAADVDPHTISPMGGGPDDELSRGAGWLPKSIYERHVPSEIRERHEGTDE